MLGTGLLQQHKFDLWKQPTRVAGNLSSKLQDAIKELKENDDIDIKLDDKGGGFVVADKKDYISSVLSDLANQHNIQETFVNKVDMIAEVENEIAMIVNEMLVSGEIL